MTDLTEIDPQVCSSCGKSFWPRHTEHENDCALCRRLKRRGVTPLAWHEGEDLSAYVDRCERSTLDV